MNNLQIIINSIKIILLGEYKIAEYYNSDLEYLMDELARLDLLLLQLRASKTSGNRRADDPFCGLYVSDSEAEALLENRESMINAKGKLTNYSERILTKELEIQQKVLKTMELGMEPRLFRVAGCFSLNRLEMDTILICAASELDPKYERLYGYLQDDLTRKYPSVGLVQELLCGTVEDMIASRKFFLPTATLLQKEILEFAADRDDLPKIATALKLKPNFLSYIMGEDDGCGEDRSGELSECTRIANEDSASRESNSEEPECKADIDCRGDLDCRESEFGVGENRPCLVESIRIPEKIRSNVENLIGHLVSEGGRGLCILQGPYGSGKKEVAKAICDSIGIGIITIDLSPLASDSTDIADLLSWPLQKAVLDSRAVYITGLDLLPANDPRTQQIKAGLEKAISSFSGFVILSCLSSIELARDIQRNAFTIVMPVPELPDRKSMWLQELGGRLEAKDIDELASKFVFTSGQIRDAVLAARNIAVLEGRDCLGKDHIYQGSREQASRKLSALSTKIDTGMSSAELVLPEDKMAQLSDIKSFIRNKGAVYYDWGFGRKLSLGKGMNILFSGSSGTGKTLAAGILARDLGLEIYKVDLSTVVSKYIGETEKNINKIFAEAREINAILFFDEADAIFGKRSEVKDSHDRYANIEVSYLLQKMEEHEGIVIMATNLSNNIDDAFVRRMHFIVEFPFPDEAGRLRIWKSLLPSEAPLSEDVDFQFLASHFKLAGGNIKNILMAAAFMAAESTGFINMEHIIKATVNEYKKVGLICSQSDFGKYYHLVNKKILKN